MLDSDLQEEYRTLVDHILCSYLYLDSIQNEGRPRIERYPLKLLIL
jgi:hypothetical protein